ATGQPIFPVEERPVPASDIPGEQASRSQPFTALTPPLSPHHFSTDSIWGTSDADRAACHAAIDSLRNEGIFTPPSVRGTFVMPSNIGGAHWGGVAVDAVRQIAVVPVNRVAASRGRPTVAAAGLASVGAGLRRGPAASGTAPGRGLWRGPRRGSGRAAPRASRPASGGQ